jgi:ferredoxin
VNHETRLPSKARASDPTFSETIRVANARSLEMALVVTEPCRGCKYTDCVVVCPCECFFQDEIQLYIDPDHCIDCMACISECPVEAIYHEDNVPEQWTQYVALNRDRCQVLKETEGAHITEKREDNRQP